MSKAAKITGTVTPPKPEDYLPAAIQKAVVLFGIQHPMTVYPLALGVSAGAVGALFDIPLLFGAALGLGLIGSLWAMSQVFFRREAIGSHYLNALHGKQKRYEAGLVGRIETDLKDCAKTEKLKGASVTGIAQLTSIQVKLANVQELLALKLSTNEITYGRFLGAAEQVTLSVLDNLNTVVGLLKSAASIDPDYVRNRLQEITTKSARGEQDHQDLRKSLQQRLYLWNKQLQTVDLLMARNEEAMTEMERISAAVAQWRTGRRLAGSDLESAIGQLHALAQQAHEYENL